jgi:hypothetical protein
LNGLENDTTGDFVAMDIREAMLQLGNITGQIDIDTDILGAKFSKFLGGNRFHKIPYHFTTIFFSNHFLKINLLLVRFWCIFAPQKKRYEKTKYFLY